MYLEPSDLLVRAQVADYERGVTRLLLESEARKTRTRSNKNEEPARLPQHRWWELGRRHGPAV